MLTDNYAFQKYSRISLPPLPCTTPCPCSLSLKASPSRAEGISPEETEATSAKETPSGGPQDEPTFGGGRRAASSRLAPLLLTGTEKDEAEGGCDLPTAHPHSSRPGDRQRHTPARQHSGAPAALQTP